MSSSRPWWPPGPATSAWSGSTWRPSRSTCARCACRAIPMSRRCPALHAGPAGRLARAQGMASRSACRPTRRAGHPQDEAARRERFIGSLGASFRVSSLIESALPAETRETMDVRVVDITNGQRWPLFYSSRSIAGPFGAPRALDYQFGEDLQFGGRTWRIELSGSPGVNSPLWLPLLTFASGVLASLLLASLAWSTASTRGRALVMARRHGRAVSRERGAFPGPERVAADPGAAGSTGRPPRLCQPGGARAPGPGRPGVERDPDPGRVRRAVGARADRPGDRARTCRCATRPCSAPARTPAVLGDLVGVADRAGRQSAPARRGQRHHRVARPQRDAVLPGHRTIR